MNSVYLVCLIAFGIHVIAVPAFIWAARRRQIGVKDQEAYQTVQSDAQSDAPSAPTTVGRPAGRMSLAALEAAQVRPYTRLGMILFFTLFVIMGVAILWAVSATVVASAYAPGAQTAP